MNTNPFHIDRYELQELLEQGGRAEVWKAFDTQARRYVAIKFLHANLQSDSDYPSRFQRVMQTVAYLRHPNIVQYFDFSLSPPLGAGNLTAAIVMDYVDGGTLADYIRNTSRLGTFSPPADITRLYLPICAAVDFAHQHGVIHGLLKPSNVLLDKRHTSRTPIGEPIVSDFAMAGLYPAGTSNTNNWLSTPVYMSPEQLMGSTADARSDIYSLGVILYELCAGTPPFPGNNPASIIMQQLNQTPASPLLINPSLPPELAAVIMRCLAKDPSARFQDVPALVAAIEQATGQGEQPAKEASRIDSTSYPASTIDMPTMLGSAWRSGQAGLSPVPNPPSFAGISGSSYPSLPTTGATPTGGGGLAAAFYRASSPGIVGASPPFAAPQPGITPANSPVQSAQTGYYTSPPAAAPSPPPPTRKPPRRWRWIALALLLIVVLAGSGLGAYFAFFNKSNQPQSSTPAIVGHAYFASSGLLSANPASNQGIADEVQVELNNIPAPQSGMGYFAWLVNDIHSQWNPVGLGQLSFNNGTATLSYKDPRLTDLLAANSRFLVTQESVASPPLTPSLTPSTWMYYSEFSQVPDPNNPKHFSLYDHIRHLLAADPNVAETGLLGGLDIWLYRNTEKILEWAGSARDAQQPSLTDRANFIRRQMIRIMDYLDGSSYTQLAQDLAGLPPDQFVLADKAISKIGLLTFDPATQPLPGYLFHIGTKHLREIALLPQSTPEQKSLAIQINQELNVVNAWFETMRTEVLQLVHMSNADLVSSQTHSLLNTVATLANTAFVGEINSQGQVTPGVVQIHYAIQRLATFDVRACTSSNPCKLL